MRRNPSGAFIATLICAFTLSTQAQNFGLVKDINTSKDGSPFNFINDAYSSWQANSVYIHTPSNGAFAVMNGIAYFAADDGIHGTELWCSNSTAAGTYMVKDITAGSDSTKIESISVAGNKLFFTANGILYKSDGTRAGTVAVPGITYSGSETTCLTPSGNILYFITSYGSIWKTDGTQAGTSLVIDFVEKYSFTKYLLGELTNVNGTLFFTTGQDYESGPELWKTDGTEQGSVLVKDIITGTRGSTPVNLTSADGKLYFSAEDSTGIHLWVSDGTANGTKPVINNAGVMLSSRVNYDVNIDISPFIVINKVLYFNAYTPATGNELYKCDLTKPAEGITLIKDIIPGAAGSAPSNLTAVDNTLYFSVTSSTGTQQLWKSNGTKPGTQLIKNMSAGIPTYFSNFINANGQLLFSCYTGENGNELWCSNGTEAGTVLVKDIYADKYSSFPAGTTYLKNGISLFSATDGIKGTELWSTDGTAPGTVMVKNINNNTTSGSNPNLFTSISFNNKLYFSAYDPVYGNGLYISDETATGTHLIKDLNAGSSSNPSNFCIFKNTVYFSADSAGYTSVYKTDGTVAGTVKIFYNNQKYIPVTEIVAGIKYLYVFYSKPDDSQVQLWVSDGTNAGSYKIQDMYGWVSDAATLGDVLYFGGFDSTHGSELWKATKAPGSAKLVKDIYPGPENSNPGYLIQYKNKLYFSGYNASNNWYVYMTDGTKTGTQTVFSQGGEPGLITEVSKKLLFTGYASGVGRELFISDGSVAGTKLLKDIYPGSWASLPRELTVMDSTVYFSAEDDKHGFELWKTDGTTNGTVLVKDILPGNSNSLPQNLAIAGKKLYFKAYDSTNQLHLYESNGKAAGTKVVADAGLNGVTVNSIAGGGNKLYINGYTYALGNELYAGISPGFAQKINNAVADKLTTNEKFTASILGNPVQDELRFSVNTVKEQRAQIVVTDVSGKVLVNKSESLNKGANNISYTTNAWASGVYTLKIIAEDGSAILLKAVK